MIIEETGNLFDSPYQSFGVTVNAFGAMGAGMARECRKRFPDVYSFYAGACNRRYFETQQLLRVPISSVAYDGKYSKQVICILTKYHWKQPSRYGIIEASLQAIRDEYKKLHIESLAIPLLGCGLGKLDPDRVRPMIDAYLGELPIKVGLFIPK